MEELIKTPVYNSIVLVIFFGFGLFLSFCLQSFRRHLNRRQILYWSIATSNMLSNALIKFLFWEVYQIKTFLPWWASPSWDILTALMFIGTIVSMWRLKRC